MTARPAPDSHYPPVDDPAHLTCEHPSHRDGPTFTGSIDFPPQAVEAAAECCRSAGLLVLLPDDALVERVARAIAVSQSRAWGQVNASARRQWLRDDARAVLSALATPGGEAVCASCGGHISKHYSAELASCAAASVLAAPGGEPT